MKNRVLVVLALVLTFSLSRQGLAACKNECQEYESRVEWLGASFCLHLTQVYDFTFQVIITLVALQHYLSTQLLGEVIEVSLATYPDIRHHAILGDSGERATMSKELLQAYITHCPSFKNLVPHLDELAPGTQFYFRFTE